ncbi:MAG: glycosyltransferase [Steroidobacteraceae bacterium]
MRFIFLIPDFRHGWLPANFDAILRRIPDAAARWLLHRYWAVNTVYGGTLNLMRHCEAARLAGADAVLATISGRDQYGEVLGPGRRLPCIAWEQRRADDVCIVPDYASTLADAVNGPVVVYQQSPLHLKADFKYGRDDLAVWTDSPFMRSKCEALFPGKQVSIVPNVVDESMFRFVPQRQRTEGLLFAFPRKNPEFIDATWDAYSKRGGRFWKLERVSGLPILELAARFREPQAFLASAREEGCALPPQEAMAAGIVVIGRTATGANFSMRDGVTALIAESPDRAADRLLEAESQELREQLAAAGRDFISRYFARAEPLAFWTAQLRHTATRMVGAHGTRGAPSGAIS